MACLDVGSLARRNRRGFRSLSQAVSREEGESSCPPNRLGRGLTIRRISNATRTQMCSIDIRHHKAERLLVTADALRSLED